ncbi:MAG TPA: riboflavin kinase [Oscillospiraceae bacterium]|mgnify:CR=1 FL=1|nr:riboflavin biosynthesis protein RibF [Oscillospiraceae bacterium]HNW03765.1 riboflavin kinase [Oscillospiraceae bacterium]HPV99918.1 riboflavin kinase [Oscillospiraceae bacterium]
MANEFLTTEPPEGETAVALGIFDGVHRAHRKILEAASRAGLEPWVFTFAEGGLPERKAGAALLLSPEMKYRLMAGCGIRHCYAPEFASVRGLGGEEFVRRVLGERLRAKKVFVGYDFRFGKDARCGVEDLAALCRENGMELTVIEEMDDMGLPISATRIREAVACGDTRTAFRLAGYPFVIDQPVVCGERLGTAYDLPTINQPIPAGYCVPKFGVYAAAALVGGKLWPAAADVGVKPTVSREGAVMAETHLIGWSGDLYGERVPVFFLSYLREERAFGSEIELFAHIAADASKAEGEAKSWLDTYGEALLALLGEK